MIVLLFASVCISSSCSKSVLNKYDDKIEGTWILNQISGGIAGQTTAPDKTTTLTFESSEKYTTTYNNQPADKGHYTIIKLGQDNYYGSNVLLKLFSTINNDSLVYGLHIAHDSLLLDEGCCDRFAYTYIRQK